MALTYRRISKKQDENWVDFSFAAAPLKISANRRHDEISEAGVFGIAVAGLMPMEANGEARHGKWQFMQIEIKILGDLLA